MMKRVNFFLTLATASFLLGGFASPSFSQNQNGPPPGGFGGPDGPPPDGFGGGPGAPPPDGGPPPDGYGGGDGGPALAGNGGEQGNGSNMAQNGFGNPGANPNAMAGGNGPGGQMPFATGTVQSLDAASMTLTLVDDSNNSQTIKVGATAQIVTQQTVSVADLKIGDQIAIQGVPTGITVSQIVVGQLPAGLPGAGGGPGQGGPPRGNFRIQRTASITGGSTGSNTGTQTASFASAQGTIKALPTTADPHLTLSLGTDVALFLKVAENAKLTKYTVLTFNQIKQGDRIVAAGQTDTNGTFAATTVGVNLPQRSMGGRNGFNPGEPQGMMDGNAH